MEANLKRGIILDHYQNPRNKGLVEDSSYHYADMNNESCIDEVKVQMKIEDGKILDIHFDGEACAICTSSSSIMVETLTGLNNTIKDVAKEMEIDIRKENMAYVGDVYDDVYKQPNRKKCALLPWWGVEKILGELEQNGTSH